MRRAPLHAALAATLLLASLHVGGCATSGACSSDDECGALRYCGAGTCRRDCTRDEQCGAGEVCTSTGMCLGGVDAGRSTDAGPADTGALDTSEAVDTGVGELDAPSPLDGSGADAPPDAWVEADARSVDAAAPRDAGARDAGRDAGGPLRPSTYTYRRMPVGGLRDAFAVAFHPDGTYAVVVERGEGVHVYDWATETATRFDLRAGGRTLYLDDLVFAADGSRAWIVGYERVGSTDTGVIITLDDAAWRRGDGAASFSRATATAAGERFAGIELPRAPSGGPGGGRPVVLSQSGTSPYIARLRELDPTTGAFSGLFVARPTSAGCDDLAFSDNEFGQWGIVLACGTNGAEILYYTEVAGVAEWRAGTGGFGNVSRTDGHPGGGYALIVNWSSRNLYRHDGGALRPTSGSPGLITGIWDVSFSPDGSLALITGRAIGATLRGTILEFRHDLYAAPEITDVSIEGFGAPPYSATSSTYLNDSAFRPGCHGGLIVGGTATASSGLVIEFQRTDGVPCR